MSRSVDVGQDHQTRAVGEVEREKAVAHIPPGEGRRSLWVLGELVTYKISSQRTGGAYSLFEVATQILAAGNMATSRCALTPMTQFVGSFINRRIYCACRT